MIADSSTLISPVLKEALEREKEQCLQILPQYEQKVHEIRKRLDHIQALLGQSVPLIDITTVLAPLNSANSVNLAPLNFVPDSSPPPKPAPKPEPKPTRGRRSKEVPMTVPTLRRGYRSPNIPFRAPYVGETMLTAIGIILRSRSGRVVSIDEVVDALYGELAAEEYKVAKDRVTKSLSKGKQDKLWNRVPNMMGCYIWEE